MKIFHKLLLLLCVVAGLPLAMTAAVFLWRSGAIKNAIIESNARTGDRAAQMSERALFEESRAAHLKTVELKAARLEAFFHKTARTVELEALLIRNSLGEPAPASGPTIYKGNDIYAIMRDEQGAFRREIHNKKPYIIYHPAPNAEPGYLDSVHRLRRLGTFFAHVQLSVPWSKSIYLGLPQGVIVGYPGSARFNPDYDPRERPWYKAAMRRDRLVWTDLYYDKNNKGIIFTAAQPVRGSSGKDLLAVAAMDVSLTSLISELFDMEGLPVSDAVLVDEHGLVRFASSYEEGSTTFAGPERSLLSLGVYKGGLFAPVKDAIDRTPDRPSGTLPWDIRNNVPLADLTRRDEGALYAHARVRLSGAGEEAVAWRYVIRSPIGPILHPARKVRLTIGGLSFELAHEISGQMNDLWAQIGLVTLFALLAAGSMALLGARATAQPLLEMAAALRRIGTGDLETRVEVRSKDEIGRMSLAINQMVAGLKEGIFVKDTFKRYVSSSVVDQILKDPGKLKLGGERRSLTVFFSDLSGFTTLSETLPAERLVDLINEYLSAMTDSIFLQQGTLDKYEGDAVMAFWGAPIPQEDHARRACWAALDNRSRLRELCQGWEKRGLPTFDMRIGINTGEMIVGNMGSHARMDYTVMGDAVNTGARLEEASKIYGTHILISEATREQAGGAVETREIDLLSPRGKKTPIRIHELLGLAGQVPEDRKQGYAKYEEALAAYRAADWDRSEALFRESISMLGTDKASSVMLQRVLVFRHHPPERDWNGIFQMPEKT